MMPADAMAPSYMPKAASCENSRNGEPESTSARIRSRGSSFPRATCFADAVLPPPSSTVATFTRKSATSAAIASRLAANTGSRGSTFVSIGGTVGMGNGNPSAAFERREPRREQHEQRADGALEPAGGSRVRAYPTSGASGEPRDGNVDPQAVEVEEAAQRNKRERLRGGGRVDE